MSVNLSGESSKLNAYVTPELIGWAIERNGQSRNKLAKALGVKPDRIHVWERGASPVPFNRAVHLAKLLRIPFGYLFLDAPPTLEIPLPDLRTLPSAEAHQPSSEFLDLLYLVIDRQEWYREYTREHGARPLPFVSRFTLKDNPDLIASDIRATLGTNNGIRSEAHSWSEYLSLFCASAEKVGILVMRSGVVGNDTRRPLSVNEFQGFAITDTFAPLVFINSRDFKAAQIFTLAHELAHIWIGVSGISNPDETDVIEPESQIENFCNTVAAEVLVPKSEFVRVWNEQSSSLPIKQLSKYFWVSSLVILRRAYELEKLSRAEFFSLLQRERASLKSQQTPAGGDYYRNIRARHGSRFTDALLSDVRQGGTVYRDAARLMNMKVPTLVKLMESSR